MRTFTDSAGRTWQVAVSVTGIEEVQAEADVDLLELVEGGPLLERLIRDPVVLCHVLYALCKAQMEAKGISAEAFGRGMAGRAITVTEKPESRESASGESPSATLVYTVRGTADDVQARGALAAEAPPTHDGLVRKTWNVEPVHIDTADPDGCLWTGAVRYGRTSAPEPETGDSVYNFDIGGGTQHLTQSIETVARYAPTDKTPPDFKGAIGVTHDSVEGVDITVPVYHFSETHYKADAEVTPAYKATLFALTGKVNAAAFKGFQGGEVLFLGASGSKRGEEDWEITFRFAASPNATNIPVGNITVASKKGWEYLWVRYADAEDAGAKALVKRPASAHVEKVYHSADFSSLGI